MKLNFHNPTVSPDGSTIAFSMGKWESGLRYYVYLMNTDGTHLHRLAEYKWGQPGSGNEPCWSPDGQWIAYRDDLGRYYPPDWYGGPLYIINPADAPTGDPVGLFYKDDYELWCYGGLDWGPDGDVIVFAGHTDSYNRLYITHVNETILRLLPSQGNNYQPVWSRAG